MTTKYNKPEEVPTEILVKRLDELSDAVVARMQGNNAKFQREFTCRIPAELDRDADLVLNGAAMRISELVKRVEELEQNTNKAKAASVRDSISYIEANFEYGKSDLYALLMQYAEKLERGEL